MRTPLRSRLATVALLTSFSAVPFGLAGAQVTIGDTRQTTDRTVGFSNDGSDGILEQRYGQTFRTPDALSTTLDTWTVWANSPYGPDANARFIAASLQLTLLEWSGTEPVGPSLYTSAAFTPTFSEEGGEQEFTFDIGQTLDPTKTYLAVISAVDGPTSDGDRLLANLSTVCGTACGNADAYGDGSLVLIQSQNTDAGWQPISAGADIYAYGPQDEMSFRATFSGPVTATPEPASLALMATGMASMAGWMLRRRKSSSNV